MGNSNLKQSASSSNLQQLKELQDEQNDYQHNHRCRQSNSVGLNGARSNNINNSNDSTHFHERSSSSLFFFRNLSERLFASFSSHHRHQSTYSVSRPWSRVSRRRWKESTLTLPYSASRTAWPVSQREACFLPEFPLGVNINEEKFNIVDQISQGTYGKVYKVEEVGTNNLYALKVLNKSQIVGTTFIEQVKTEVQFQKLVGHHVFIVNYKYHWQNKKYLYIVSDYIEGGELFHLLKLYGVLPDILIQLYIAEIAVTIDFLHNAGIIHRDLKLENILLDTEGHIKLIDFGFAKWLSHGSKANTICGSILYMAPEVALQQPYGHAADWWSLGVIACAMMTNKLPTPAAVLNEINNSHDEEEASTSKSDNRADKMPGTLPDNVNLDLPKRDFLLRLLQIDPSKRLRSVRTMQTIAFYKGYNIEDVKNKKVMPKKLLEEYYPHGPPEKRISMDEMLKDFSSVVAVQD